MDVVQMSTLSAPKPTIVIPPLELSNFDDPRMKKARCGMCPRKLTLSDYACKCGIKFCAAHRSDVVHNCTFDYKAQNKELLEKTLEKVVQSKVSII